MPPLSIERPVLDTGVIRWLVIAPSGNSLSLIGMQFNVISVDCSITRSKGGRFHCSLFLYISFTYEYLFITGLTLKTLICKIDVISSITKIIKCHCATDVNIVIVIKKVYALTFLLKRCEDVATYTLRVWRAMKIRAARMLTSQSLVHGEYFYLDTWDTWILIVLCVYRKEKRRPGKRGKVCIMSD